MAHDPQVLATDAARIAHARSVDEAMRLAVGAALAAENVVVGDRDGHIGVDDLRRHPAPRGLRAATCRRRGPTARIGGTAIWATTSIRASSIRPTGGCGRPTPAWSAAQMLERIGDGGYTDGIRAWMIRDNLQRLDTADERALFDVQLDNRSIFLDRWRDVFLAALTPSRARPAPAADRGAPDRRGGRGPGRSAADSVAYRIVRTFRLAASRMAFDAITAVTLGARERRRLRLGTIRRIEGPLWRLVNERPAHLLDRPIPPGTPCCSPAIDAR